MVKVLFAALFAAIVCSGPVMPAHAASSSYITPEGTARMMAADGIAAQWDAAKKICAERGLAEGSGQFLTCFMEYQIYSLRALRARFRSLTDAMARHYGLCIDRRHSRMVRCAEI